MICSLCPRSCGADRALSAGFCSLGDQMVIGRIAPHLWEEPPVSGRNGTGAVCFSGCTLRCVYCQNGEISHRNAGRVFSPQELADAMKRLADLGVHTISLITGTPFVPQILEALRIWRPPLPLVWNTSGYETVDTIRMLDGIIDVYLPDLKHYSPGPAGCAPGRRTILTQPPPPSGKCAGRPAPPFMMKMGSCSEACWSAI